jgi:SAM-dependent methyltransferase
MTAILNWLRDPPTRQRPFDPRRYFLPPMFDLGEVEPRFSGILAPEPERGAEKIGITDQFLQNADTYHARYLNTDHYQRALTRALEAVSFRSRQGLEILDIGTGSGANSVVPCTRLFHRPRIIATDLSPNLLAILRHDLQHAQSSGEVACVCTDAMNNFFKPVGFDLVIGVAILHHLLDPMAALRTVRRALRPGGVAVFFEPFEATTVR